MTTGYQHGYRCTIASPPEYERLVAEISVNGRVLCLLLWESSDAMVEVKFEGELPPLPLEDFMIFAGAAATYLRNGLAERPESVLAHAIASREEVTGENHD
jgi:hypothetical protein